VLDHYDTPALFPHDRSTISAREPRGESMGKRKRERCANPLCRCETAEFTCSLWCGPLDVRQSTRCQCRHDACGQPVARPAALSGGADVYPPVLDRFRIDRQVAAGTRSR
jgi:hypothetical protein